MAEEKPAADSQEGKPVKRAAPNTKIVLIVDDDEAIVNLLDILVRRDGFKVLRAESGAAAIYKLARKPDAILLDLVMPGKSGIDVLNHLRDSGDDPPKVIVITGHVDDAPEVKAVKKDPNVAHFMQKPINQDKLLTVLHDLLKTRKPEKKESDFRKWED